MILKPVLRRVRQLAVGCIQTRHTDFLPPQVYGRSWRGFRVGVHTCFYQLIALINIKHPSNYLWMPSFLLLTCVYHIYCISVHLSWNFSSGVLENCKWDVSKPDTQILFPRSFTEGRGEGAGFCDFTCCHQCIDWLQGSSSSSPSLNFWR